MRRVGDVESRVELIIVHGVRDPESGKDESQFRAGFDLMNEMKSLPFAEENARLIMEKA